MTDGDALMRSVLAAPADDAPRLIYADWLEEQGRTEDAEFIRVQIELARLGFDGAFHTDELGRLQQVPDHVGRLQERQLELWMGGYGRPDVATEMVNWPMSVHPIGGQSLRIRRGFVERIASFAEIYLLVARDLFARQPVTHVRLVDRQASSTGRGFAWLRASDRDTPDSVPGEVWSFLTESEACGKVFATADRAESALSWACVRYGRAEAGLIDWPGGAP